MDLIGLLDDKEFCQIIVGLQVFGDYHLSVRPHLDGGLHYHIKLSGGSNRRNLLFDIDTRDKEMMLFCGTPNGVREEMDKLMRYMGRQGYNIVCPKNVSILSHPRAGK